MFTFLLIREVGKSCDLPRLLLVLDSGPILSNENRGGCPKMIDIHI